MAITSVCRQSWTGNMGSTQFTSLFTDRTTTVDAFGYGKVTVNPAAGYTATNVTFTPFVGSNGTTSFTDKLIQDVEVVNLDSREAIKVLLEFGLDMPYRVLLHPKERFVLSTGTPHIAVSSGTYIKITQADRYCTRKTKAGIIISAVNA